MNIELIELYKQRFANHKAIFTDYGNVKILDFIKPGTNEYRIRFLFEEDYCRLHISGDLGELIACNYSNMTYDKFSDFVNNIGYFESKVICHNRPFYTYDYDEAYKDIKDYLTENDCVDEIEEEYDEIDDFIEFLLDDYFSFEVGLLPSGINKIQDYVPTVWEDARYFGQTKTDILELYMLAFKLAQEKLKN